MNANTDNTPPQAEATKSTAGGKKSGPCLHFVRIIKSNSKRIPNWVEL